MYDIFSALVVIFFFFEGGGGGGNGGGGPGGGEGVIMHCERKCMRNAFTGGGGGGIIKNWRLDYLSIKKCIDMKKNFGFQF